MFKDSLFFHRARGVASQQEGIVISVRQPLPMQCARYVAAPTPTPSPRAADAQYVPKQCYTACSRMPTRHSTLV